MQNAFILLFVDNELNKRLTKFVCNSITMPNKDDPISSIPILKITKSKVTTDIVDTDL
ncbi:hypothetical protein PRBRB14_00140 [Hallella multisaccharivorax DSM 17128]|nr:hypothetical protein PRBRB14_00140 [Hallella multisaccharivorax DSM 17128]